MCDKFGVDKKPKNFSVQHCGALIDLKHPVFSLITATFTGHHEPPAVDNGRLTQYLLAAFVSLRFQILPDDCHNIIEQKIMFKKLSLSS